MPPISAPNLLFSGSLSTLSLHLSVVAFVSCRSPPQKSCGVDFLCVIFTLREMSVSHTLAGPGGRGFSTVQSLMSTDPRESPGSLHVKTLPTAHSLQRNRGGSAGRRPTGSKEARHSRSLVPVPCPLPHILSLPFGGRRVPGLLASITPILRWEGRQELPQPCLLPPRDHAEGR